MSNFADTLEYRYDNETYEIYGNGTQVSPYCSEEATGMGMINYLISTFVISPGDEIYVELAELVVRILADIDGLLRVEPSMLRDNWAPTVHNAQLKLLSINSLLTKNQSLPDSLSSNNQKMIILLELASTMDNSLIRRQLMKEVITLTQAIVDHHGEFSRNFKHLLLKFSKQKYSTKLSKEALVVIKRHAELPNLNLYLKVKLLKLIELL